MYQIVLWDLFLFFWLSLIQLPYDRGSYTRKLTVVASGLGENIYFIFFHQFNKMDGRILKE